MFRKFLTGMKKVIQVTWDFMFYGAVAFILVGSFASILPSVTNGKFYVPSTVSSIAPPYWYAINTMAIPANNVPAPTSNPEYLSGVKTCDELIRVWRPVHLPVDNVKVECVDRIDIDPRARAYVKSGMFQGVSSGPIIVYLKRGYSVSETMGYYEHEAWHAVSFRWNVALQREFIASLGETSWDTGGARNYLSQPQERWAWAATACFTKSKELGKDEYKELVPGGCDTVKHWLKRGGMDLGTLG